MDIHYGFDYRLCSGLCCPVFHVHNPPTVFYACVYLHTFDFELEPTIAKLDLLFQGKPIEIQLLFTTITFDTNLISCTTYYNDKKITFEFTNKLFMPWYTYLRKRKIKTDKDYVCESHSKKEFWSKNRCCINKHISTVTKDASLCLVDKRYLRRNFIGPYTSMLLYVGVPSIHSWRNICCNVIANFELLVGIVLLLEGQSTSVETYGFTMVYSHETNILTFTETICSKKTCSIKYIPEYHKQIFELLYISLCKTLLRAKSNKEQKKIYYNIKTNPTTMLKQLMTTTY